MRRRVVIAVVMALSIAALAPAGFGQSKSVPLKLKVGAMAPDFTLRDQDGKEIALRQFRGKKTVVLAFYIFAFTGG